MRILTISGLVPGIAYLFFERRRDKLASLYDLILLTNGGSITALTGLKKDFAEKVLEALEIGDLWS